MLKAKIIGLIAVIIEVMGMIGPQLIFDTEEMMEVNIAGITKLEALDINIMMVKNILNKANIG